METVRPLKTNVTPLLEAPFDLVEIEHIDTSPSVFFKFKTDSCGKGSSRVGQIVLDIPYAYRVSLGSYVPYALPDRRGADQPTDIRHWMYEIADSDWLKWFYQDALHQYRFVGRCKHILFELGGGFIEAILHKFCIREIRSGTSRELFAYKSSPELGSISSRQVSGDQMVCTRGLASSVQPDPVLLPDITCRSGVSTHGRVSFVLQEQIFGVRRGELSFEGLERLSWTAGYAPISASSVNVDDEKSSWLKVITQTSFPTGSDWLLQSVSRQNRPNSRRYFLEFDDAYVQALAESAKVEKIPNQSMELLGTKPITSIGFEDERKDSVKDYSYEIFACDEPLAKQLGYSEHSVRQIAAFRFALPDSHEIWAIAFLYTICGVPLVGFRGNSWRWVSVSDTLEQLIVDLQLDWEILLKAELKRKLGVQRDRGVRKGR